MLNLFFLMRKWKFTYSWFWYKRRECLVSEIDLCLTSIFLYALKILNFNLHKNPQFICRSAIFIIMSTTARLFPVFRIKYFICRIHDEENLWRRIEHILSKLKIHPLYCQVLHFCSCPSPDIYFSLKTYCVSVWNGSNIVLSIAGFCEACGLGKFIYDFSSFVLNNVIYKYKYLTYRNCLFTNILGGKSMSHKSVKIYLYINYLNKLKNY